MEGLGGTATRHEVTLTTSDMVQKPNRGAPTAVELRNAQVIASALQTSLEFSQQKAEGDALPGGEFLKTGKFMLQQHALAEKQVWFVEGEGEGDGEHALAEKQVRGCGGRGEGQVCSNMVLAEKQVRGGVVEGEGEGQVPNCSNTLITLTTHHPHHSTPPPHITLTTPHSHHSSLSPRPPRPPRTRR